ncbi:hypothetical protein [Halomicrobium katesii]|nr:hypothetical protein [Halomicrobium katesii]
MDALDRFDEPPWLAAVATTISYGLVLLVVFLLLFVVPYALLS